MPKRQSGFISPIVIVILVVISLAFYAGFTYGKKTSQITTLVEAAKGGKPNVFEGYADCSLYKQNASDTTPPTVSITKPPDGQVVSGVKGNDIFWINLKVSDDNGYVYPALYVNDAFALSSLNMLTSSDDPSIRMGYIHVKPNQTYALKAKACDNGGNESWSQPVTFTTTS